jgi:CRISPR-associated protein Csc3
LIQACKEEEAAKKMPDEQESVSKKESKESEEYWLELLGPSDSPPLKDYLEVIANHELRRYQEIIQEGKKAGQTYYTHVLDGVMAIERLRPILSTNDLEARCLFLAFTIHDINKIPPYSNKATKYVNLATPENIGKELDRLHADAFFPEWRTYLGDITALARLHQGHLAVTSEGLDRRPTARHLLDKQQAGRVEQLGRIMQAVDVLALSMTLDEQTFKDQFLNLLNASSPEQRYHFVYHQLSEHRGILSNVIHNTVAEYFKQEYGALPLLYYPDGVAYLLPEEKRIHWDYAQLSSVAQRIAKRLADIQSEQLRQFIKPRQFGIAVDAAALESGAGSKDILEVIYAIVLQKRYADDWKIERAASVREDLSAALKGGKLALEVAAQIEQLVDAEELVPRDDERLRLGEYATAYRKLIDDHAEALGLSVKDSWARLYQLLSLPQDSYPIYNTVNSYRRGYFLAQDIPAPLADLQALHDHFLASLTPGEETEEGGEESGEAMVESLREYLNRTLSVIPQERSQQNFATYLLRYVTEQHNQCCNCSTMLPTQDWMSANAPPSIGVQSFSNRLAGASLRDPKRHICPICRAQFILEKIAWMGHSSKQGMPKTRANGTKEPGYTTFYLYLYPHAYFTEPFLKAWIDEVERLRNEDTGAFMIDTQRAFREWLGRPPIRPTKMTGVALPKLAEATSNVPLLPINAPGQNYGEQFLLALEKAVLLHDFFGCRVVLSRLPAPPVDAASLADLFVDGLPRNLLWLLVGPGGASRAYQHEANLANKQTKELKGRLACLHKLSDLLRIPGEEGNLVHDLAVGASDDPLRLFYALDRAIEQKVASETRGGNKKSGSAQGLPPDRRATQLSRLIAPIARQLVGEAKEKSVLPTLQR